MVVNPAKVSNPMIERLMGTVIVEEDTRYSLGTSGAPALADQPSNWLSWCRPKRKRHQ
jgi:hypothetical protein